MKNVLSIAGSDSSGGAGVQADLKTMCAFGVYGMTAITAVTAQNTQGVYGVQEIAPDLVAGQIEAVFKDIRVDAVKIGMVFHADIVRAVGECLTRFAARNIVLDPVMVSKSGCELMRADTLPSMRSLLAIADVVTPNIPEAELLCGFAITTADDMRKAAERMRDMGARSVLVKGGHRPGEEAADVLLADGRFITLETKRIATPHTHGTGCTLSSAIACRLALGDTVEEAARAAKDYITEAIAHAYAVGGGCGPVGHLTALYHKAGMGA